MIKKVFLSLAGIVGAFFICLTIFLSVRTNQRTQEIKDQFEIVTSCLDEIQSRESRLPTEAEFIVCDKRATAAPTKYLSLNGSDYRRFGYQISQFSAEVIERFGTPPANAYLLSYWRGEQFEYFASWNRAK
jgi:hypothetical protein